jgi:hypothetical protein
MAPIRFTIVVATLQASVICAAMSSCRRNASGRD